MQRFKRLLSSEPIRVRYAPSPTGELHLGGLRTALYNHLVARQSVGGKFILRIEDTDRSRLVDGAAQRFDSALRWAGLQVDEGPEAGGDYGPYTQSERGDIYRRHADVLLASGHAYRCFCSAETLQRARKGKMGAANFYDRRCADLTAAQIDEMMRVGRSHVVRLRVPRRGTTSVDDLVRGRPVHFDNALVDDQVLMKSDGMPTYHLASVVDDHLMRVSHVIRGDEWLISTPKHVLLYEAFGWRPPAFVHLPLLLNAADRSKLSKRQAGASVEHYRERGYRADALINFVALLGWSMPDGVAEVASAEQLVDAFDLRRVHCSPAVVDVGKLDFFNRAHMLAEFEREPQRVVSEAAALLAKRFGESPRVADRDLVERLLRIVFERPHVHKLADIVEHMGYAFERPPYGDVVAAESLPDFDADTLASLARQVVATDDDDGPAESGADLLARVRAVAKRRKADGVRPAHMFALGRLALAGRDHGPPFAELVDVVGIQESIDRFNQFANWLVKQRM
jgi:glutamyl-tRNA synthetase